MLPYILTGVICFAVAAVLFFVVGVQYRKKVAEKEISSAEEEAKRIINESIKSAESKKREALVEAKEEILQARNEYEREVKERRADLQKQERRLQQKEETWTARPTTSKKRKRPCKTSWPSWRPPGKRSPPSRRRRWRCWSASPALPPRRPRTT